jgi:hypothetical protein
VTPSAMGFLVRAPATSKQPSVSDLYGLRGTTGQVVYLETLGTSTPS